MLRKCFLFLILVSCFLKTEAQFVTAYSDYRNYFYVFNQAPQQVESAPVLQYKIAGNSVAYINTANELRAWHNGEKFKLGEGLNANLAATGNMLYYTRDNALTVIDKGNLLPLSYFLGEFKAGDNIIAFKDSRLDLLKVYYQGEVQELEYTLVSSLGDYNVGDNVVAYINGSHYFKVFCQGETYELSNWEPAQFLCGKDMVAYIDGSTKQLNVFTKDKIIKLENFPPISMKMGDDIFAFVSDEQAFKVYTNGKLLKLESYTPDFYEVKDNILAFFAENKFQVIYKGTRYVLESFQPRSYQISNDNMAYMDHAGRLKYFDNGNATIVTTETIESYDLNGNVLKYDVPNGTPKVYWNGKNY